ncbi:MAG: hypothetical protein ACK4FF_05385 [Limnobacter sp.]|uniref:hypothetical protein n=1 Tax=Limnobacter sp. TaxID=2003368 RepID=UPI00391CA44D
MKTILVLAVYFLMSCSLFYMAFCRLSLTSESTKLEVRALLWLLSTIGAFSVAATVVYGYLPSAWHISLLAVLTIWQASTKHKWAHGAPDEFQKKSKDDYPCQLTP